MAYLFDDASSHRLTRTPVTANSWSIWFNPDDSGLTCTIWAQYNGAGTQYKKLQLAGAVTDTVVFESFNGTSTGQAVSVGTVNYNAWNHVYWGTVGGRAYISLNGETLVDGGASSYISPTVTLEALGRVSGGLGIGIEHYSGMLAEFAAWSEELDGFGDERWHGLPLGFDPRLVPVDPTGSSGYAVVSLVSYSPLVGNPLDLVRGNSWTVSGATVAMTHPSIRRNFVGG